MVVFDWIELSLTSVLVQLCSIIELIEPNRSIKFDYRTGRSANSGF